MSNDTTTGMRAATSPDRTTWTDRTGALPAGLNSPAGTYTAHIGAGGGYFVVAAKIAGTVIQLARASGATPGTWNGTSITANTITTLTDCSNPVYSDDDAAWIISLYGTAPGDFCTELWRSTDNGASWQLLKVLSNSGLKITWLANIGHLWVGLSIDGFLVYSMDAGYTTPLPGSNWYSAGMHVATNSATHLGLWSGGGGLMEIDWGGAAPNSRASSVRLGNLLTPALT